MINKNSLRFTFPSFFNESLRKYSDNEAMSFVGEKPITYREVDERVQSVISFLEKNNISKGDKVAILSSNIPNYGISYLAITFIGAVAVPLLPDFTTNEITNILKHSESKAIFATEHLYKKVVDIKNEYLKYRINIEDFTTFEESDDSVSYIEKAKPSFEHIVEEEDLATIIYTSGTTGKSKGVMLTHKNFCFDCTKCLEFQPVLPSDRFLSILPLSHTFEMTLGLLLPMFNGAHIFYLKKPPVPSILIPAMKKVKPTILLVVPLIIEKIFKSKIKPAFSKGKLIPKLYRFSIFRKFLHRMAGKKLMETFGGEVHFFGVGGAKLDAQCEAFLREAKFPYAIGYGLTETAPMVAGATPKNTRFRAVGPTPTEISMKIHNPDPKTKEGEIWVKGDMLMKGYYKEPELTKEVITEDGWFRTGDLGTLDKDGYVSIKGRIKNVIVEASGENVYPEEIEAVIHNFRHVNEAIVVQQKGKLVALVNFNMEEIETKYRELKKDVRNYVDTKSGEIKQIVDTKSEDFKKLIELKSDELKTVVDARIETLSKELQMYVNQNVNKFSQVQLVVAHPTPFQKTATHKIKRFLYTK
ncbi:long-chain fatty acid--CoA ligase [Marinilabiliaceae bacterium JC040]|nr:long-chain fatty acid--CoA ligase [Marinilabiliaceae bacterium JC040]